MRKAASIGASAFFLVAVFSLVLVQLLGTQMSAEPAKVAAQESATPEPVRKVTVLGQAAVEAEPDTAVVRVGVVTEATSATLALDRNSQRVSTVLAQLKSRGVAEDDIQTSAFWVSPMYARDNRPQTSATAEISGYRVTNTLQVIVRDLNNLGAVLGAAVEAGANEVYGVELRVDDPATLREQAQAEAFRDARSQAQRLAQAAGAALGQVLAIDTSTNTPDPVTLTAIGERAAGDVPVQAGAETVRATVRVTYALNPPASTR